MTGFNLTGHQERVVNTLLEEVKHHSFGLYGSAGVGKTYCLNYVVNYLRKKGKRVLVTAPTHKALQVLRKKVNHPIDLFKTVHSYLGYRMHYFKDKVYFKPEKNYYPPYFDYIVVDEASMVNEKMVDLLSDLEKDRNTKVIPVGDLKQLPPVGEQESLLLYYPGVELTKIVRQKKGNKIIDLSRNLDMLINREFNNTDDYVFTYDTDFNGLINGGGFDLNKYISWQRKTVYGVSDYTRAIKYGLKAEDYVSGEVLYFENPPKDSPYHNNQEVVVDTVKKVITSVANKTDTYDIEAYWLTFLDPENGHKLLTPVITPSRKDQKKFDHYVKELGNECFKDRKTHPREYYNFIERWASLKSNYALTVHRSQGSTYYETQINLGEILSHFNQDEMVKMLYTAITRASDKIRFIL